MYGYINSGVSGASLGEKKAQTAMDGENKGEKVISCTERKVSSRDHFQLMKLPCKKAYLEYSATQHTLIMLIMTLQFLHL